MNKKDKIIIGIAFSIIMIVAILIVIKLNHNEVEHPIDNEESIPKIKENYTSVVINEIKKYNEELLYDEEKGQVIYYKDGNKYLVYMDGIFYNDKIIEAKSNYEETIDFKNFYYYVTKDYSSYCIKNKSTSKSSCYDYIYTISDKYKNINYLILENNDNNYHSEELLLLDLNNGKTLNLKEKGIIEVILNFGEYGMAENEKFDFLAVRNNNLDCGLINYDGKLIIDYKYDYLTYINKDYILANKDDKTGIINYKDETILDFIYDDIDVIDNYIITIKDNKLSVLGKNKKVIVNNIDVKQTKEEYNFNYNYNLTNDDNKLYLSIENEDKTTVYLITNKLERKVTVDGTANFEYDSNKVKYVMFETSKKGKYIYNIYDNELYQYYKLEKDLKDDKDYSTFFQNINNNYYVLGIIYSDSLDTDYYYIDMLNSKEVSEEEAEYMYFKNGYGYTIINGDLRIYKDKKLLNKFNGMYEHLNNYYFLEIGSNYSKIVEIQFKKESH